MDSRDDFVRDTDSQHEKIVLTWKASSFIGSLPDDMTFQEPLYPDAFYTDADIKNYWSVPERLVDIRWLKNRQGRTEQTSEDVSFSSYIKLEFRLYRIVTTLGEWVGSCEKNIKKLNENPASRDDALLNQWQPEGSFLQRISSGTDEKNGTTFSTEDLGRLHEMAKEFAQLRVTDARRGNLQKSAQKLQRNIEKTYGSDLKECPSLALFHSEEVQTTYGLARDFSKKAYDFLINHAWREESPELRRLSELEDRIRKAHPDWRPEGTDRWSEQYQQSLWKGLQFLADDACAAINGTDESVHSIEDLLNRVDRVIKALQISPREKTILYNNYIKDNNRCVALLDIQNGPKILAFSGFWDCADAQSQSVLGCSDRALNAFQNIGVYLKADLAVLSTRVVDKIIRYKMDRGLRLVQHGPMRTELPRVLDKDRASFIKREYSCCERKILAELAARGGISFPTAADLYVKFQPCLSCYGALTSWMNANAIQLTVDYPEMQ